MNVAGDTRPMPVADAHFHLWDLNLNRYPWLDPGVPPTDLLGDLTAIRRSFLLDDYLREAQPQGVVKAVHVQADHDPSDPVRETRWLQELADASGFPHAIIAAAKLEAPDLVRLLEAQVESANVRGVRQSLNWTADPNKRKQEQPDLLNDSRWLSGFALLADFGLTFDLQIYPEQMQGATSLARSFPQTLIVLNHLGMPVERDGQGIETWQSGMRLLSSCENVVVKISGFGLIDAHWTVETLRVLLLETLESFGPERVMFGSNFPVENLTTSLSDVLAAVKLLASELSDQEQRQLLYENAMRYYHIA